MMTQTTFSEWRSCYKPHVIPFVLITVLLLGLYLASMAAKPGWVTWALSSTALLIVGLTVLARLSDITPDQTALHWQFRRTGLILIGMAATSLIFSDPMLMLFTDFVMTDFPSWKEVTLRWGVAFMLLTTPHMPPWWRYITGEYRTNNDGKIEHRRGGDRRETSP